MNVFQDMVKSFEDEGIPLMTMSTLTEEGVIELRNEVKTCKYICLHVNFVIIQQYNLQII